MQQIGMEFKRMTILVQRKTLSTGVRVFFFLLQAKICDEPRLFEVAQELAKYRF